MAAPMRDTHARTTRMNAPTRDIHAPMRPVSRPAPPHLFAQRLSRQNQVIGALNVLSLAFMAGTLELKGVPPELSLPPVCAFDARTSCHRAPASAYAEVVRALVAAQVAFDDQARRYQELSHGAIAHREPRPYQSEAVAAWKRARGRGVIVLPTGAGKSHVAVLAIDDRRRSALVVAPTLDLVRQWYDLLSSTFGVPIGVLGGVVSTTCSRSPSPPTTRRTSTWTTSARASAS